ncbi:sugar-phosphatase [Granulicella aggregans]|uniref:Sugar-phosphatase n=1 Tax=Granulicella aggregans TaxID=474949 RepID=A0A7W7ZIV6_9BACT|nr:HAD-IA family hydrolase [Granulicella aggregans]MBB5060711.1 sugar-phosphatase [Granulicella aggregans]
MPAIEIAIESVLTTPVEIAVGGLLFDMDGVLVRSTHGDERCWTRWAAHHGLSDTFDLRRTHGRRAVDTIREHLPDLTVDSIADHLAQLDSFAEEEQSDVTAYPGVVGLLASLQSYRWAVVTSASEKMMRSRLAAAGIPTPTHAVGGDTLSMGKPHPEGYLRGAGILTRQPQECLVIEDAPAGVRAGKAAGCQVLAVASSHCPSELQEADWIIASIDQIAVSIDPETSTLNLKFPALQNWQ